VAGTTKLNSTSTVFAYGAFGQDSSASGSNNAGVNGLSVRGVGASGKSTSNYGVRGTSAQNFGVFGSGTTGVNGVSTAAGGAGVRGVDLNTSGIGVQAIGGFYGVFGQGTTYGVYGTNMNGTGVYGTISNNGTAGSFTSNLNLGLYATSHTGFGLYAHSGLKTAAIIDSSINDGVVASSPYQAVLAEAAPTDYGLLAQNSSGQNLFYVDGNGNIGIHGSLHSFLTTTQGGQTAAFSAQASRPTIEDSGTAQLVNGRAVVALNPTFARTIEGRNYRVILSPDGDTPGIYVTAKSTSQFGVREARGGHGTIAFDYYLSATELGRSGAHMTMAPSRATARDTRVPPQPSALQPQLPLTSAGSDTTESVSVPVVDAATTCATTAACVAGNNTSSGPGIAGTSSLGSGVSGVTKFNSTATTAAYGIFGQDASTSGTNDAGVFGVSVRGVGSSGKSTSNYGVRGTSTQSAGVFGSGITGVYGTGGSTGNETGVWGSGSGTSATGAKGVGLLYGVYGTTTGAQTSSAIYGATASGTAVNGFSNGGTGGEFTSTSNTALVATSDNSVALQVHSTNNAGALIESGNYVAAVVKGSPVAVLTTTPSNGFPLVAQQANGGPTVFYVDGLGNMYYHGTLQQFLRTTTGTAAIAYGARSTHESIQDSGTAQLINGSAVIKLGRVFAGAIASYHVFLTAEDESRGLYVAAKSPSEFVVREASGGRDSFAFDYHIYAQLSRYASAQVAPPRR
jgi:hypothetical protein